MVDGSRARRPVRSRDGGWKGRLLKRMATWPWRWAMGQVIRRFGRRTDVGGFTILDATRDGLPAADIGRIGHALALVGELAPERHARMRREMAIITVAEDERVEYARVMRSGFLSRSLVTGRPPATLAAVLVGLAARARVSNRPGGWRLDPVAKARLLRLDALEQMRFIRGLDPERFTNTAEYRAYLEQILGAITA